MTFTEANSVEALLRVEKTCQVGAHAALLIHAPLRPPDRSSEPKRQRPAQAQKKPLTLAALENDSPGI